MKAVTSLNNFSLEEVASAFAMAPDHIDDPDCPYDPNDPGQVHGYWKNAIVVQGGGLPALREALKRSQGVAQTHSPG